MTLHLTISLQGKLEIFQQVKYSLPVCVMSFVQTKNGDHDEVRLFVAKYSLNM